MQTRKAFDLRVSELGGGVPRESRVNTVFPAGRALARQFGCKYV